MYDVISRKELFERFQKQAMTLYGKDTPRYLMVMDIMDGVRFAPAVDAAPVVHAHWITKQTAAGTPYTVCSYCNTSVEYNDEYGTVVMNLKGANYCPNCGAKMDER